MDTAPLHESHADKQVVGPQSSGLCLLCWIRLLCHFANPALSCAAILQLRTQDDGETSAFTSRHTQSVAHRLQTSHLFFVSRTSNAQQLQPVTSDCLTRGRPSRVRQRPHRTLGSDKLQEDCCHNSVWNVTGWISINKSVGARWKRGRKVSSDGQRNASHNTELHKQISGFNKDGSSPQAWIRWDAAGEGILQMYCHD